MPTALPRNSHSISLLDGEIVEESDLGSMRRVTADNFPILTGLSIKRVLLNPGSLRTPHWHANANELTYCVSGTALVSILDNGSKFSTFIVTAGQMFHADSGSLHHIENIGEDVAEFIITFRAAGSTTSWPPASAIRLSRPRPVSTTHTNSISRPKRRG